MADLKAGRPWYGSTLEHGERGNPILVTNGRKRALGADSHLIDAAGRVARMDELRVDTQVLSLVPLLFGYDLGLGDAAAMTRDTNDEIAGYVRDFPGRFLGLANIPVNDTDQAIAELERAMALPEFVGLPSARTSTDDRGTTTVCSRSSRPPNDSAHTSSSIRSTSARAAS